MQYFYKGPYIINFTSSLIRARTTSKMYMGQHTRFLMQNMLHQDINVAIKLFMFVPWHVNTTCDTINYVPTLLQLITFLQDKEHKLSL